MSQLLKGRTILVSGVGLPGGIGTTFVNEVRQQGGNPIITCHPDERIIRMAQRCAGGSIVVPCDFSEEVNIIALCEVLRNQGITIDGFLHSIASSPMSTRVPDRTFLSMTFDELVETIKVNAWSFHWLTDQLMGGGNDKHRILSHEAVGVAMTFELGCRRYIEPYWAMAPGKELLYPIALNLDNELSRQGVRIRLLNAGPVLTFSAKGVPLVNKLLEALDKILPMRRKIRAEDVCHGISWLMSPQSEMSDLVLTIDGGLSRLGIAPVHDPRTLH
ncbi:MAG: SDR family oxidoreductase [Candidatus Berkelbacteria bacterium]